MPQTSDVALVVSAVLFAGAAGLWWDRAHAAPAPSVGPAPPGTIVVRPIYEPRLGRCEPSPGGRVGDLRFAVDGACVRGVSSAVLFRDQRGGPHWGQLLDVAGVQLGDRLSLTPWVERRAPAEDHHLGYTLLTERDGREEWVCGWATVRPLDVRTSSLVVRPAGDTLLEVCVRTGAGQPVPGALVLLDPTPALPVGTATHFVYTDGDGAARVRGLEPRTWWVALPEGVGPATAPVEATAQVGKDARVVLTVAGLDRPVRFARQTFRLGLPGASERIESLEGERRAGVPVWPVARWIGPGRGPETPVWFLRPEGDDAAGRTAFRVRLAGRRDVALEVRGVDTPAELAVPLPTSRR